MIHQPPGKCAACHAHEIEESLLALRGVLTVGWGENGRLGEERLGPRDLIFNSPERLHCFRNDGMENCQFHMAVGTPSPETVRFKGLA